MQEDWEPVMFNTSKYKDTGLTILSSVDDIQTILDDHIVKTQTMKGSPFIKPFEEGIKVSLPIKLVLSQTYEIDVDKSSEYLSSLTEILIVKLLFSSYSLQKRAV
jgi:hypothetical protein